MGPEPSLKWKNILLDAFVYTYLERNSCGHVETQEAGERRLDQRSNSRAGRENFPKVSRPQDWGNLISGRGVKPRYLKS
jgi:hypothetical protein